MRGLFLFQRDLRLEDQNGLSQALSACQQLCLSLVIDPELSRLSFNTPLEFNAEERFKAAMHLENQLITSERPIICGVAETISWVSELCDAHGVECVWLNAVNEPLYLSMYLRLDQVLMTKGIQLKVCQDSLAVPFDLLLKKNKEPYKVFTPFYKLWLSQLSPSYLSAYDMNWDRVSLLNVPQKLQLENAVINNGTIQFKAIKQSLEQVAELVSDHPNIYQEQWEQFKKNKMATYDEARDYPSLSGTSELSAAINNGQISFRQLVLEARETPGGGSFLRQLAWRSFYQQILCAYPEVMHTAFIEKYRDLTWSNDPEYLRKWQAGETGYDLIDAAMIQLKTEGRMQNRLRMLTASFLVKQLDIDWRIGEAYFYRMLRDGDLAPNNGGWQWCASTGTDAQPYFRRFNPHIQAEKFDSDRAYQKQWLGTREVQAARLGIKPCVDLKQSGLSVQLKYKNISLEKEVIDKDE